MSTCVAVNLTGNAIGVVGVGMALLTSGICELNYACELNQQIQNCEGKIIAVDLLIKNLQGEKIGIKVNHEGNAEFILEDLKSISALESIRQIKQRYSKNKVLHELQQSGYKNIKQEKLANGNIRIVVEKWE
ncbi:MAG: DUF1257 domain-containing protein [Oligoflexia bacterium]|nr:DUF1257 domain-containing protein [Oligoflexia bacterium]